MKLKVVKAITKPENPKTLDEVPLGHLVELDQLPNTFYLKIQDRKGSFLLVYFSPEEGCPVPAAAGYIGGRTDFKEYRIEDLRMTLEGPIQ